MTTVSDHCGNLRVGGEMGDERCHVGQRDTEVRIHKKNDTARRPPHARADCASFAAMLGILHHADHRVALPRLASNLRRIVPAGFDHHNDLAQAGQGGGQSAQFPHGPPDPALLAPGWHHN